MGNSGRKSVTLSICMMIKNEERNLKRCLSSLKGIADELIVVDTGSDDSSVSIAESFGAKVYHHPFEGDIIDSFSKYRNLSIGYASSDWVMIVDADEEVILEAPSASHIKTWLVKVPPECMSVAITLRDIQKTMKAMQFNSVRFFRKGHIKYQGIVHNTPVIINGAPEALFCPLVSIKHYGYDLTPQQEVAKRQRSESLLLRRIEEDPDDVIPYFYLVQSHTAYSEYTKAAEYIEKYSEVSKRIDVKFNGSIYCTAVHVYKKLSNKKESERWLLEGLKEYPRDLDLLFALIEFGVWTSKIDLIIEGSNGYIEVYNEYQTKPTASGNRFTYANTFESLSYALFHAAMAKLQQGSQTLGELKRVLPKTPPAFQTGVATDVTNALKMFGLVKEGWELPQETEPRKVINLSGRR